MVTVLPKKYTNGSINIKPIITKITPIKRDKKKLVEANSLAFSISFLASNLDITLPDP